MRYLISKKQAARAVGYHPEHIMRLVRAGQFPRPIKINGGRYCRARFAADEVEGWICRKLSARDCHVSFLDNGCRTAT